MLRVAAAIGTDAFGFVLWNLTARSPWRLARDIAQAARHLRTLAQGVFHFVVGLVMLTGGGILVLPLVGRARDFLVLETLALIAALVVDQLIGADARRWYAGPERG